MRVIIPCAGYGTRMGMEPDKSKELLIDPSRNKPLIDYSLELCKGHGYDPFVITRREKTDLIDYLDENSVEYMFSTGNGEWMDSVLQTESYWGEHNLLVFPDTKFSTIEVIREMEMDMKIGSLASIALHKVKEPNKWCIVDNYWLMEKPMINPHSPQTYWAFGLIMFHKSYGIKLFHSLSEDKYLRLENTSFKYLDIFVDLTRTGKL